MLQNVRNKNFIFDEFKICGKICTQDLDTMNRQKYLLSIPYV